jgi:tRNA(fMet)-specific endonuclease VapC
MGRILIDTNAYSAMLSGDDRIADVLATSEAILLSPVVMGELYDGFLNGSRYQENHRILERFRGRPRTIMVPITETTAEWFGRIKHGLRRVGRPIPINDVWIAASCMEHGASLLTLDAHFDEIVGLLRYPVN